MDEYVQEFRRAARGSGYERRVLVEEFKRELNGVVRRRLAEVGMPLPQLYSGRSVMIWPEASYHSQLVAIIDRWLW